ncbi:MAG: PEP-CTERM sorting domain-containing protein [Planctomycetota bacterium]
MLRPLLTLVLVIAAPCLLRAEVISISASDFESSASIIDFESQTTTALPTSSEFRFLQFVGDFGGSTFFEFLPDFPNPASFGGTAAYANTTSGASSTGFTEMGLEFTNPVEGVGFLVSQVPNFLDDHAAELRVSLFDDNDVLLGFTDVTTPEFDDPTETYVGLASTSALIKRVEVTSGHQGTAAAGFFGVDNISFGDVSVVTAIPEPSSTLLLSVIAFGLVGRRRR